MNGILLLLWLGSLPAFAGPECAPFSGAVDDPLNEEEPPLDFPCYGRKVGRCGDYFVDLKTGAVWTVTEKENGTTEQHVYNHDGSEVVQVTDKEDRLVRASAFDKDGRRTSETTAVYDKEGKGTVTTLNLEDQTRMIEQKDKDGNTTEYTAYGKDGQSLSRTKIAYQMNGTSIHTTENLKDRTTIVENRTKGGKTTSIEVSKEGRLQSRTSVAHNTDGTSLYRTKNEEDGSVLEENRDEQGRTVSSRTRDPQGRLLSDLSRNPDGSFRQVIYESWGRVVCSLDKDFNLVGSQAYDREGRPFAAEPEQVSEALAGMLPVKMGLGPPAAPPEEPPREEAPPALKAAKLEAERPRRPEPADWMPKAAKPEEAVESLFKSLQERDLRKFLSLVDPTITNRGDFLGFSRSLEEDLKNFKTILFKFKLEPPMASEDGVWAEVAAQWDRTLVTAAGREWSLQGHKTLFRLRKNTDGRWRVTRFDSLEASLSPFAISDRGIAYIPPGAGTIDRKVTDRPHVVDRILIQLAAPPD